MKSQLDLKIVPARPAKRRAARSAVTGAGAPHATGASRPFPFGEIIRSDRDLIGRYHEECGRRQLCITRDQLNIILQHGGGASHSTWKMGPAVCRRSQPRDVHRVVSTKFGWRVQRRLPHFPAWHELGHIFANIPVLFPSPDVAIAMAEMLIRDRLPQELVYLTEWLRPWFPPSHPA